MSIHLMKNTLYSSQNTDLQKVKVFVSVKTVCGMKDIVARWATKRFLKIGQRCMKMVFGHVRKVQHIGHLFLGVVLCAQRSHTEGDGDTGRGEEEIVACLRFAEFSVELPGKGVSGSD